MSEIVIESAERLSTLHLPAGFDLDSDAFLAFCGENRDKQIERDADGTIIVMSPSGGETGRRSATILLELGIWARNDQTGVVLDSSAGFRLANGAIRSADAVWVSKSQWLAIPASDREVFPILKPEFVVEILSPSDSVTKAKVKMAEYMTNGVLLGWLIDPVRHEAYVYRSGNQPESAPEKLENPDALSADPILKGFMLPLKEVWI